MTSFLLACAGDGYAVFTGSPETAQRRADQHIRSTCVKIVPRYAGTVYWLEDAAPESWFAADAPDAGNPLNHTVVRL